MSIWNYRCVRDHTGCVSIRVVWYNDAGTVTGIDTEHATVCVDPSWTREGETVGRLIRDELDKFALALTCPILIEPTT